MARTYEHTLRYSDFANDRPLFQNYIETDGRDTNLNRTQKRYYSSQDVSIYFGDFFIDDACSLQYSVTESAMLLYGYNSYIFDDIAKGSRMIQGQFTINFTHTNYLSKVLSDISKYEGTGVITHSKYHALWPTGFDLLVHHGSKQHSNIKSNDLQVIILKDIYITGVSTLYDSRTGEPIQELYSFVGRDIHFGVELQSNDTVIETEKEVPHILEVKFGAYTNKQIFVKLSDEVLIDQISYAFGEENIKYKLLKHDKEKPLSGFIIDVDQFIVSSWIEGKAVVHLIVKYKDYPKEEYTTTLAIK